MECSRFSTLLKRYKNYSKVWLQQGRWALKQSDGWWLQLVIHGQIIISDLEQRWGIPYRSDSSSLFHVRRNTEHQPRYSQTTSETMSWKTRSQLLKVPCKIIQSQISTFVMKTQLQLQDNISAVIWEHSWYIKGLLFIFPLYILLPFFALAHTNVPLRVFFHQIFWVCSFDPLTFWFRLR